MRNIKELEEISKVLKLLLKEVKKDKIQMFDCEDIMGDYKICLLDEDGIRILYAPEYEYVEILGLSAENYNKIYQKFGY